MRKEYKELLRVKKTAHRKKVLDALHKVKQYPKTFWGKLKCLCKKKELKYILLSTLSAYPTPFPQKAKNPKTFWGKLKSFV